MNLSEEYIKNRIEQLKKEREAFVVQANQQISAYNAAINELELILKPEELKEEPKT